MEKELKTPTPVIAAGGIWTREDIEHAFDLGASGVQMGTRFACTMRETHQIVSSRPILMQQKKMW